MCTTLEICAQRQDVVHTSLAKYTLPVVNSEEFVRKNFKNVFWCTFDGSGQAFIVSDFVTNDGSPVH